MAGVAGSWRLELYTLFCSMIFTLRRHSVQRCRWCFGHVFSTPFAGLRPSSTHRPAMEEFSIVSAIFMKLTFHRCSQLLIMNMWSIFHSNESLDEHNLQHFRDSYVHTYMSPYCRSRCLHLTLIKYCLRWLIGYIWKNFHMLRILLFERKIWPSN